MKIKYHIFIILVIAGYACSSTKYVPKDQYLLDKVIVESDDDAVQGKDLKPYLKQQTNIKILGIIKFHLGMYNLSGKKNNLINRSLKKIGEAPVIYNEISTTRSVDELKKVLKNKGYMNAEVKDSVVESSPQKVKVFYVVRPGTPYRINEHHIVVEDDGVKDLILSDSVNSLIKRGIPYDLLVLDKERDRIAKLLRNNGYYNFSKEYIDFVADSTIGNRQINDTLFVRKYPVYDQNQGVRYISHQQFYLNNLIFITDYNPQEAIQEGENYLENMKTTYYRGAQFLYKDQLSIKPEVLQKNCMLNVGQVYKSSDVDRTHSLLSSIPAIQYVNIRFVNVGELNGQGMMDCYVQITLSKSQSFSVDAEVTHASSNYGAALNFIYSHKNAFKGAEQLNFKVRGARDTQAALKDRSIYNSDEAGFETSVRLPKFVFPYSNKFRLLSAIRANTDVSANFNFQDHPDFTKFLANLGLGYDWNYNKKVRHTFDILDFNYVRITDMSQEFKSYIDTTYLRFSYEDHVIHNINYTFSFNDQALGNLKDSRYLRFTIESAGNALYGLNQLLKSEKDEGSYEFLGVKYSQYLKGDISGTYNKIINEKSSFVYHGSLGIGFPYGNLLILPFEKRYFGGGANSIRAWQVRTLGPGTYTSNRVDYMNQSGDIRLEMNLEYRFKFIQILEGALFVDAGNIWTIREYESQPGGAFKFDQFYKQIAVGYGFGTRFDFSFLVLRVDLGIKGYDPVRHIVGLPSIDNDVTLNFAIGYPF